MSSIISKFALLAVCQGALATYLGPTYPSPIDLASSDSQVPAAWANFTSQLDAYVKNAAQLPPSIADIVANGTWSVNFFSTNDPKAAQDLQYHHTGAQSKAAQIGTKNVTSTSLYRVASVTKMTSVYVAKLAFSEEMWNLPLSEIFPELGQQVQQQGLDLKVNMTRWNEITPFALASQLSGIASAVAGAFTVITDTVFTYKSDEEWIAAGMPSSLTAVDLLDPKYVQPCNLTAPCPAEGYVTTIAWRDAVRPAFSEPGYSNNGFILFGAVMERLLNKTLPELYKEHLIDPLGLKSTSLVLPDNTTTNHCSNCVITGLFSTFENAGFPSWGLGSGSLLTTLDELAIIGSSVMNSTLLTPVETRKWLKPVSHTSNLEYSVGAPWEIVRYTNPLTGKITDIYPKSGDSGDAGAEIAIIPDFDVGFSFALSYTGLVGIGKSLVAAAISDLLVDNLMPALEAQAAREAQQNFAGIYAAGSSLNSSITIKETRGGGLNVTSWISNSTDLCAKPFSAALACPFTLQPTDDTRSSSSAAGQVAFRVPALPSGTIAAATLAKEGVGLFSRQWLLGEWFYAGSSYTSGIGTDLFIFNVAPGGNVSSMSPAPLRITLNKQS